jgi:CDP-glucose 4,6-dehydratase
MFGNCYANRRVFVLGHTGFKGSWLYAWLEQLGADVHGYALAPPTEPSHFDQLELAGGSTIADIRDFAALRAALEAHQPEVVFHLAAQPSVLVSYGDPLETFSSNVLGTAHVLEAIRHIDSVRAAVIVTTDKCYDNKEWVYAYRENDALGGHDPYSASKACTEIVTACFRNSFFATQEKGALVASARAGNVIGGGDWTADRLLPDAMRAASLGEPVGIRNPNSTRPWQHVLEPLSGYLRVGQALLAGESDCADAWNFGPNIRSNLTTLEVLEMAKPHWPAVELEVAQRANAPHEAGLLMVDSTKASRRLRWRPIWDIKTTVAKTVEWYRAFYEESEVRTSQQLRDYVADAAASNAEWAQ